jgi:hypothetical protein
MRFTIDAVQIVENFSKGRESCDFRMEGERRCDMKIIVMTEAASEGGALLKANKNSEAA